MKFFLFINVKMSTIVGILTFLSRKTSIIGLPEPEEEVEILDIFILMNRKNFMLSSVEHEGKFMTSDLDHLSHLYRINRDRTVGSLAWVTSIYTAVTPRQPARLTRTNGIENNRRT